MKNLIIAMLVLVASAATAQKITPSKDGLAVGEAVYNYLAERYVVKNFTYLEDKAPTAASPGKFQTCRCAGQPWSTAGDQVKEGISYGIYLDKFEQNGDVIINVKTETEKEGQSILRISANIQQKKE